jgi:heptosyltransferase-2
MNNNSLVYQNSRDGTRSAPDDDRPILIVPYMWIGDFVRCHTVVRLLKEQFPYRPVDILSTTLCAPLADYMPGVRQAVIVDLPRRRLALRQHRALARRLRREGYASALIMPRTWKSALAPFLAGIPERTGFFGEARILLINDRRPGERALPRMVDRCAMLAMPRDATALSQWPLPELVVPSAEIERWRNRSSLAPNGLPVVALAPGAVGPSKRWPASSYSALAQNLAAAGINVWIVGGPDEVGLAAEMTAGHDAIRNLAGTDLRNAIFALADADVAVSNDSGLLHVAAAAGTPTIGIFGPTSPWHWAPLNPLAAIIETTSVLECRPCHRPTCRLGHHRCMQDIPMEQVLASTRRALDAAGIRRGN